MDENKAEPKVTPTPAVANDTPTDSDETAKEIGGRKGPDPTRYGDWEKDGRCVDF